MRTLGGNNYDIMRLSILTLALAAALQANAQTDGNQTILTIDNQNISREEFQRLYMKNNTEVTFDSASLAEYMRLFIDYKLKVIEAEELGMDTTPGFIREFSEYCAQLEKPYLTDASVDDSLAREAYEHMKWDVRASHILIKCSENASAADTLKAYKRAQDIRKRALKEDFNKLARETSEDPSAVRNGGDLGYFTAFSMIYEFEKVAYATEVGAVSQVFRSRFGYHIIKVFDRRPNPGQVRASHIMIGLPQNADEAMIKNAHDKALMITDSLTAGADWGQMVQRYSDDKSTKQMNGDLQWFSTGTMVASFEEAVFKMKNIGEISAPVRTSYGWHIIKLLGKKPVGSYESMQEEIKQKLSRDVRNQFAQRAVIERLKHDYKFTEDKTALNELISCVDTTVWYGQWNADKAKGLNKTIFTIADTIKFSQQDYAKIVAGLGSMKKKTPIEVLMANDYKKRIDKSILDFERTQLPRKYPEFKYLLQEYHDGILIFSLMDKMVWTKASTDSAGLASFYEANKDRYMWGDRAEVAICSYKFRDDFTPGAAKQIGIKIVSALKAGTKKGDYETQIKAALQKLGVTPDSVDMKLTVKPYNIVDGKTEDGAAAAKYCDINGTKIDMNAWGKSKSKIIDGGRISGERTEVLYLVKQVPPTPKTLDECRGTAIADYQDALEKEWVAQLRAKHTVKINEKVFNSLIKNK